MNIAKAMTENLPTDIEEARAEARLHMERYVEARTRLSELEALHDLQQAMAASTPNVIPLKVSA